MGLMTDVLGSDIQRIGRRSSSIQKRSWSELHAFFDRISGYGTAEKNTIKQQLDEYRSWIHICCNVIYRRVSEIDFRYFREDNDEEVKKNNRIYSTINKIFKDPNEFMEFRFLKQWIELQLDLTGQAFILREDDPVFGKPMRMWPLNVANLYKIEMGDTFRDYIKGFTFIINGRYITYSPENILYFHFPHPEDPRMAASPIQSQSYVIDIDHYIEAYERGFFKNSVRPDFAITYPQDVTIEKEDGERIIAEWKKRFGGEDQWHQATILDQGAKIEKMTVNNEDLALVWLAQWSQDKVLASYGVPAGKVGLQKDINKSNQFGAETTFNSECILPRLRLMDEVFTRGVLQRFDERLEMRHDNPIPRDKEELIKEAQVKTGVPTRTVNRQRELDGEKPYPGGDVIMVPLNYIPLGSIQPPPEKPERPTDDELEEESIVEGENTFTQKEHYSDDWLDRKWYAFKAYTEGWESVWMTQLRRLFEAQQEEVIENLESWWDRTRDTFGRYEGIRRSLKENLVSFVEKHRDKSAKEINDYFNNDPEAFEKIIGDREPAIAGMLLESLTRKDDKVLLQLADHIETRQDEAIGHILFDWDKNKRAFDRTGRQLTGTLIQEVANEELTSLGMEASFSLENRLARAYLGTKVAEFSESVLSTKAEQLSRTLTEGFKAGEGIRKLTQRVQGVYGSVLAGGYEAQRIARTEVVSASNAGSYMGYQDSRVVKEKGWLSARDQRTRGSDPDDIADHWNMNGDRVRLNEGFLDGRTGAMMLHPGDTSLGAGAEDIVSCRCGMVPYTTQTTRIKNSTIDEFREANDLGAVGSARVRRAINPCYG